uniref:Uncharacterized protein n=1 Tax=Anguilla anguilla TaxID=7936 RepID=A0A0E9R348_ANGAN
MNRKCTFYGGQKRLTTAYSLCNHRHFVCTYMYSIKRSRGTYKSENTM